MKMIYGIPRGVTSSRHVWGQLQDFWPDAPNFQVITTFNCVLRMLLLLDLLNSALFNHSLHHYWVEAPLLS